MIQQIRLAGGGGWGGGSQVRYIHNKKIAHRDIKPENIVLMFGDTAKLCDFGWSRVFDSDMKKTFCGTLDYVSPEMKDKG